MLWSSFVVDQSRALACGRHFSILHTCFPLSHDSGDWIWSKPSFLAHIPALPPIHFVSASRPRRTALMSVCLCERNLNGRFYGHVRDHTIVQQIGVLTAGRGISQEPSKKRNTKKFVIQLNPTKKQRSYREDSESIGSDCFRILRSNHWFCDRWKD